MLQRHFHLLKFDLHFTFILFHLFIFFFCHKCVSRCTKVKAKNEKRIEQEQTRSKRKMQFNKLCTGIEPVAVRLKAEHSTAELTKLNCDNSTMQQNSSSIQFHLNSFLHMNCKSQSTRWKSKWKVCVNASKTNAKKKQTKRKAKENLVPDRVELSTSVFRIEQLLALRSNQLS